MIIKKCAKCGFRECTIPEICYIDPAPYYKCGYNPTKYYPPEEVDNICQKCSEKGFLLCKWSDLDEKCIINTKTRLAAQDGECVYFCETHGVGFSTQYIMPDEPERSNRLHGACRSQQERKCRNHLRTSNPTP